MHNNSFNGIIKYKDFHKILMQPAIQVNKMLSASNLFLNEIAYKIVGC